MINFRMKWPSCAADKNHTIALRKLYFLLLFSMGSLPLLSQTGQTGLDSSRKRDLVGLIKLAFHKDMNKAPDSHGRKVYYSFLPVSSQVPGGGIALVTSTTAGFYLGDRKTTSLSTITFSPYITFTGRVGYTFRSNFWLPVDKWEIMGDTRFLYYPQYTWGLGGKSDNRDALPVNYKYIRFYQSFLRRIRPYFLLGVGYHLDAHFDIDTINDSTGLAKFTGYPYGTTPTETSISSGLSLSLLYDSRRNAFNPLPGLYGNIVFRLNPGFLGSTDSWQSLYVDIRRYISFSNVQQNKLAFWSFYWTALKTHAPYLDLPSVGWDPYQQRSGRGFPQNRYRGNGLLYFESEYRRDITRDGLLGFVLFTNFNSVTEPATNRYSYIHMAEGAGLRIKFNKRSGTNISLDYGKSRQSSMIYLNLGETF